MNGLAPSAQVQVQVDRCIDHRSRRLVYIPLLGNRNDVSGKRTAIRMIPGCIRGVPRWMLSNQTRHRCCIAEKRRVPGFALADPEHVYEAMCRHPNFRLLSLDVQTIWSARALSAIPDIFDRLIVAEARRIDAPILTCDRVICESGLIQTIWD